MSHIFEHDGGAQPLPDYSQVRPIYRGPPRPTGVRITCAMAQRLDWSHDGGQDDIVGYEVLHIPEEDKQ